DTSGLSGSGLTWPPKSKLLSFLSSDGTAGRGSHSPGLRSRGLAAAHEPLWREHRGDLNRPPGEERPERTRQPSEARQAPPSSGIGPSVSLANGATQAFAKQLPGHWCRRSQCLAGASRIRDLEPQVGDLPREIHDTEDQVDVEEDPGVTERAPVRVETEARD